MKKRDQRGCFPLAIFLLVASVAPGSALAIPNTFFVVTDYGAIPNDGLSDFNASRAAIEAAAANGGGIVYYPCGTYTTGTSFWESVFRINSGENNIWIQGANKGCVTFEVHQDVRRGIALGTICPSNGLSICRDGLGTVPLPNNIKISGITFFDSDPATHAFDNIEESHGLYAYCDRCEFFDLNMVQMGDEAFDVHDSKNLLIRDSACATMGVPSGPGKNDASCFNIQNSQTVLIQDCLCEDPSGGPFSTLGSTCFRIEQFNDHNETRNIVVDGLRTENFAGFGLMMWISSGLISQITIQNSDIGPTNRLAITNYGDYSGYPNRSDIRIVGNIFNGAVKIRYSDNLLFADNVVDTTSAYMGGGFGVKLQQSSNVVITNNIIRNVIRQCIFLESGSNAIVSLNQCIDVGSSGTHGIESLSDKFVSGTIDIIKNSITMAAGSKDGIHLPSPIPIAVRDNTIVNAGETGILASGTITGNQITNSGGAGIALSPVADDVLIGGNTVDIAGGLCIDASESESIRIAGNQLTNCSP